MGADKIPTMIMLDYEIDDIEPGTVGEVVEKCSLGVNTLGVIFPDSDEIYRVPPSAITFLKEPILSRIQIDLLRECPKCHKYFGPDEEEEFCPQCLISRRYQKIIRINPWTGSTFYRLYENDFDKFVPEGVARFVIHGRRGQSEVFTRWNEITWVVFTLYPDGDETAVATMPHQRVFERYAEYFRQMQTEFDLFVKVCHVFGLRSIDELKKGPIKK